jgi:hypothetical protein
LWAPFPSFNEINDGSQDVNGKMGRSTCFIIPKNLGNRKYPDNISNHLNFACGAPPIESYSCTWPKVFPIAFPRDLRAKRSVNPISLQTLSPKMNQQFAANLKTES